ncbi:MAG: periplasmic heavy metal sensor [Rhodobacterales bacterium]|nr:periplasmic heavy metal sensor [Rhodobacterales bacterium]
MTDPDLSAPPPAPPRAGRGLRLALFVSLAINLAFAGVVAGAWVRGHDGQPHRGTVRDLGFGPFSEALTPEDRAALLAGFRARGPAPEELRRQSRADIAALTAALRADPFDPEALRRALRAQVSRLSDRLTLAEALLFQRLVDLDPAARAAFADRLERGAPHGPDHHCDGPPRD